MDIKIIETGIEESLTLIDPITGINWINDLMGNHNELPEYDDDAGLYLMSQDGFDWWNDLVSSYQKADNRYHALSCTLDSEADYAMTQDVENISCDLEDYPAMLNQVCDTYA